MAQVTRIPSGTGNTQFLSDAFVPKSVESSVLPRSRLLGFSSELKRNRELSFGVKVRSFKVVASVAAAEKPSKVPEIVLLPIEEISGTVQLPGSKSLSNRMLLLAVLSEGTTKVDNLLNSDDVHYMLGALRTLGLNVEVDKELKRAIVEGCGGSFPVGKESKDEVQLFLGNTGTAMRPLTAAVTAAGGNVRSEHNLASRPLTAAVTALNILSHRSALNILSTQYSSHTLA